jgi:two-component system phosphate regulon sensor histidine kinase PhoR
MITGIYPDLPMTCLQKNRQPGQARTGVGKSVLLRLLKLLSGLRETMENSFQMNPAASAPTMRIPSATDLPWTILVVYRNVKAEMNEFAGRRNLLLGVFALLAIVIATGTYMVARAIAREFAVMRLQSEFVSAVSHEFRTPLTSLRQLSEVLNEGRPLEEKRLRNYYQVLDRATRRLHKLVEGLLDFGRMEARSMVYRKRDLAPGEFLMSVVNEFQSEAADSGYPIETHMAQDLPGIHADPEALGSAVWNLLDNAVKYSPECRTIRAEVECEGTQVAIRVKDQGLGIPADEHSKIMRKFVRGAAAETMGIKGTGVGLAMVKHVVDAHGGTLRIESVPGKGSTFSILLPAGR